MSCPNTESLLRFRDGNADSTLVREITGHIAHCARCDSFLRGVDSVRKGLSGIRCTPPDDLRRNIMDGIAARQKKVYIARFCAAVACVVIVIAAGLLLLPMLWTNDSTEIQVVSGNPSVTPEAIATGENQQARINLKNKGTFELGGDTNLIRKGSGQWDLCISSGRLSCDVRRSGMPLVLQTPVAPAKLSPGGRFEVEVAYYNKSGKPVSGTEQEEISTVAVQFKVLEGVMSIEDRSYSEGEIASVVKRFTELIRWHRPLRKYLGKMFQSGKMHYFDGTKLEEVEQLVKEMISSKVEALEKELAKHIEETRQDKSASLAQYLRLDQEKVLKFQDSMKEHAKRYDKFEADKLKILHEAFGGKLKSIGEWNEYIVTEDGGKYMKTPEGRALRAKIYAIDGSLRKMRDEMGQILSKSNPRHKVFLDEYFKILSMSKK